MKTQKASHVTSRWMLTAAFLCLGVVGLLTNVGCAGEGGQAFSACNPPCSAGTVCNYAQGVCVADPGQNPNPNPNPQPQGCQPPLQRCGAQCVDLQSDPLNCGSCGQRCGVSAQCVLGRCQCVGNNKNCNQQWADGCECTQGCDTTNPTQCTSGGGNSNNKCDPARQGSCTAGPGVYCDTSTGANDCKSCPAGFSNCDGTWGCECKGTCNGNQCNASGGGSGSGQCDPARANSCGSDGAYCDSSTKQCAVCQPGFRNCDGMWNCEPCTGVCMGSTCNSGTGGGIGTGMRCATHQYNACGDSMYYCDPMSSTCKQCDNFLFPKRNCDGIGGCEVSGKSCSNTGTTCDPNVYNACGNHLWYCDQSTRTCRTCPSNTSNCDGVGFCEQPGTYCSPGTGTGGYCNAYTPWSCGSSDRFCDTVSNTCQQCAYNMRNCDGVSTCETYGTTCGGTGTGGSCDPNNSYACGGSTFQYCDPYTRTCKSCSSGARNCNKLGNDYCENYSGSCSGGGTGGGGSCYAGGVTGTCIDTNVSTCGGTLHTGLCPGASNIRCCTVGGGGGGGGTTYGSCTYGGQSGVCQNDSQYCAGSYRSGLCPGASSIRCCLGGGGGGGGGGGTTGDYKVWIKKTDINCNRSSGLSGCKNKDTPHIKITVTNSFTSKSASKDDLPKDGSGWVRIDWQGSYNSSHYMMQRPATSLTASGVQIKFEEDNWYGAGGSLGTCYVTLTSSDLSWGYKRGSCYSGKLSYELGFAR
jgi:hypothetical protein